MRLVFEDRYEQRRTLCHVKDLAEAFKEIHKFLDEHNFKSYYSRITHFDKSSEVPEAYYWIDVGSHSEFFLLFDED